jgi:hypothetical protein
MADARRPIHPYAAAAALLLAGAAWADDTISTDRPDFVESSDVVGRGRFQIETGFQSERANIDGVKTRTRTTPTLLRVGVSDTLELRAETDGFAWGSAQDPSTGATEHARGFSDWSLGAKWHMQDGDDEKGTPSIAWLLHADLDTGSPAFRGRGVRPSLRLAAEWELPQDFSVGVMPGLVADQTTDGRHFTSGILAVTAGKAWTPQWRTFIEIAGQQLAARRYGGSVVTFDAGATYLVTHSVQLDVAVSRGLNDTSPDFVWGVGLSARF